MPGTAKPISAVVAAAVLFGTAGTAQALGPDSATPIGVGTIRIVGGTMVLWLVIMLGRREPGAASITDTVRTHWRLMAVGGLGVAVYTPAFLVAVDRTGVAVGTIVAVGIGPFCAGALEWAWREVRPNRGWFVGTTITVTGGVVLVAAAGSVDRIDAVGLLLALAAGAGYALYSVTSKVTMSAGVTPTLALAAPFTLGSAVVAALAVREPFTWVTTADGAVMAVHLAVATTGLAYLLFGYGLHRLTSATTVTLVLAEPLTAALLATVVLDETLGVAGWTGVAAVLVGLLVVGRTASVGIEPIPAAAPSAQSVG